MRFCELTEQEYRSFQETSPCANFLNSLEAREMRRRAGIETELVGVKNDRGEILAAAFLAHLGGKVRYTVAQRGYLADYSDRETLKFFTAELKKHLKKNGSVWLQLSPHLLVRERDNDGNLVEGGFDNTWIIRNLEELGFIHRGFTTGVPDGTEVRWEYSLYMNDFDWNADKLIKHFNKRTRNHIVKGQKYGVKVKKLTREELDVFMEMEEMTAKEKNFEDVARDRSYYENLYDCYGEHAEFLLAYLDADHTMGLLEKEQKEIDAKLEKLRAKRAAHPEYKNLEAQENDILKEVTANEKYRRELAKFAEECGNEIPLSTGVFMVYPYEITSLSSGSKRAFSIFDGANALRWYTMNQAIRQKINRYNFYGLSGDFSKDAEDYGVFQYKKGYGGAVEENVGDFYLPLKPLEYKLYRMLRPWKE